MPSLRYIFPVALDADVSLPDPFEPEIPRGEVELVNASRRRCRRFEREQQARETAAWEKAKRLSDYDLGHPFEPLEDLIARAERHAERQWRQEHDPALRPRPNPTAPERR